MHTKAFAFAHYDDANVRRLSERALSERKRAKEISFLNKKSKEEEGGVGVGGGERERERAKQRRKGRNEHRIDL